MPTFHTPVSWVDNEIVTYSRMTEEINNQLLAVHSEAGSMYFPESRRGEAITVDGDDHLLNASAPQPWVVDHIRLNDSNRSVRVKLIHTIWLSATGGATAFTTYPLVYLEVDYGGAAASGNRQWGTEQSISSPTTGVLYVFDFGFQVMPSSGVAFYYPVYLISATGGTPTVQFMTITMQVACI